MRVLTIESSIVAAKAVLRVKMSVAIRPSMFVGVENRSGHAYRALRTPCQSPKCFQSVGVTRWGGAPLGG